MSLSSLFFFSAVSLISSVWFLYPFLLWVLSRFGKPLNRGKSNCGYFSISVVIAAHNEASNLANRITNVFESDYPTAKIEVIVVSDGSTDETHAVVDRLKKSHPD